MHPSLQNFQMNNNNNDLIYPQVRRDEAKEDIFHGNIKIKDPYHYLAIPNLPETKEFKINQSHFLKNALSNNKNFALSKQMLIKLNQNQENITYVTKYQGKYLYVMKKSTSPDDEGYPKVYLQDLRDGHGIPTILIDPNAFTNLNGAILEESEFHFSIDSRYLAYMVSIDNSGECRIIRFIDLLRGIDCEEKLSRIKYTTIGWTKFRDEHGLFYAAYTTTPNKGKSSQIGRQQLYYHRMGSDQGDDVLILDPTDSREMFPSYVSPNGEVLIILKQLDCWSGNQIYILNLREWLEAGKKSKPELVQIVESNESRLNFVAVRENLIYFHQTDKNRVIGINYRKGKIADESKWEEIIKPINGLNCISCIVAHKKYLLALYSNAESIGSYTLALHSIDGTPIRQYAFDNLTISFLSGNYWSSEVFLKVENISTVGKIYRIDLGQNEWSNPKLKSKKIGNASASLCCCRSTEVYPLRIFKWFKYPDSESDHFVNYTIYCKSKDGTRIPILLCHDKNLTKKGNFPCLLRIYGSYGVSMSPKYSTRNLAFMKYFNGIIAIACVRGGGEFGSKWHENGIGFNKQNSIDDCIAAARQLIKDQYTCPKLLCLTGIDAGGTLVGMVLNQNPELFGAAAPILPCMDLLKLSQWNQNSQQANSIYATMIQEYGNPDVLQDFENLKKLSPLQILSSKTFTTEKDKHIFPSVLISVGNNLEHFATSSFKYISELQNSLCDKKRRPLAGKLHLIEFIGGAEEKDANFQEENESDIHFLAFISEVFGLSLNRKDSKIKRLLKHGTATSNKRK